MKNADVDFHRSNQWPMSSGLKVETEELISSSSSSGSGSGSGSSRW